MIKEIKYSFIFMAIILCLTGFKFNFTYKQRIDLNISTNKKEIQTIAEEIMRYVPEYYIANIKPLNKNNYPFIQLGYFVSSKTEKTEFQITYDRKNLSSDDVDQIKEGFNIFIPQLAKEHYSYQKRFKNESKIYQKWIQKLFKEGTKDIFNRVNEKYVPKDRLNAVLKQLKEQIGDLKSVHYVRAQYYKPFLQYKESIMLNYKASFTKIKQVYIYITLDESDPKKKIMNVNFSF